MSGENPGKSPMKAKEIYLFSTQELIDELAGRYDHMIFHGIKKLAKNKGERKSRYKGDLFVNQGLCAMLQSEIYAVMSKKEQE